MRYVIAFFIIIGLIFGTYFYLNNDSHTITGKVSLSMGDLTRGYMNIKTYENDPSQQCIGQNGYNDMHKGTVVQVLDSKMSIIAMGVINGSYISNSLTCVFTFTINNVPDSNFYSFRINLRNGPGYTKEDMEAANWSVVLSLGE